MALARILVDGYSLLHHWPELAPGRPRHSEFARNELVHVLTRFFDATGTPITVVFDGTGTGRPTPPTGPEPVIEILFSRAGQTADQMIERAAHRLAAYGEILVVTNDTAERDTVEAMGAQSSSCANFIRLVENALTELQDDLRTHNRAERNRFHRNPRRELK